MFGIPLASMLELLLCRSTAVKLLEEARCLGLCNGKLRIEGIRGTCLCERGVCMESNGGPLGSVELPPAKGLRSQQLKSQTVGV